MTGIRLSCLTHGILLFLITGCAVHIHPAITEPPQFVLADEEAFVAAVAVKMPLWDADEQYAYYEYKQIAKVKADILRTQDPARHSTFSEDVEQLRIDWDVLNEMDDSLHKANVI